MKTFYTSIHQYKNNILVRGIENGKRVAFKERYKPYLFTSTQNTNTPYQTLDGNPAGRIDFDSISDARSFVDRYADVSNFKMYGLNEFLYTYIFDNYDNKIEYDESLMNIISLDIEVFSEDGFPEASLAAHPIVAITMKHMIKNKFIVFGLNSYIPENDNVTFIKCRDEKHLLLTFLEYWTDEEWLPDILTGWYSEMFDVPYIVNRMKRLLPEDDVKRLSPWGIIQEKTIGKNEEQTYIIYGVTHLDYLELYKKFSPGQKSSWKLNDIALEECNEAKLDYSAYGDLTTLYKKNYQLYISYNIHDTELVSKIDAKCGFIAQVIAVAYDALVTYSDTLATVRPWDIIVHNHLLRQNIVVPFVKFQENNRILPGGYVKDSKIGKHKWIVSFDFTSLYPKMISQMNISPETYKGLLYQSFDEWAPNNYKTIKGIKDELETRNVICAGNFAIFDRARKGIFPIILEKMFNDRVKYNNLKKKYQKEYETTGNEDLVNQISIYNNLQYAKKIQFNSFYGAIANKYFRWFNHDMATAITMSGQMATTLLISRLNEYLNKICKTDSVDYIIAADTDSVYVSFEQLVQQHYSGLNTQQIVDILDKISQQKIEPFIQKQIDEFVITTNGADTFLHMKREAIAESGIFLTKKRYAMDVWDNEGVRYKEPKLKVQGIEAVRSSTPIVCREKIKDAIKIILRGSEDEYISFIDKFKHEFNGLPEDEIACPSTCNNIDKYQDNFRIYSKGTPMHVKGALLYNHFLKKMNISNKYPIIREGEKIKFICLRLPNNIQDKVISMSTVIPKEFGLDGYVDKDAQFEKVFVEPLKRISDLVGWSTVKINRIEDFF